MPEENETFMWYIGIDPGFTGAIAAINHEQTDVRVWNLPTYKSPITKKKEFNFEKYANMKDFDLQSTQDAVEQVKVGIGIQTIKTGIFNNYVHKPTGSGVSVYVPIEAMKEDSEKETTSNAPPVDAPLAPDAPNVKAGLPGFPGAN